MSLMLGQIKVMRGGCLTRLVDIVNRSPSELEDLVGFHRGRLAQGFYILVLQQKLAPGEFEFFGYTYMSGGKFGLPSNNPGIEASRLSAQNSLTNKLGKPGVDQLARQFSASTPLKGEHRLVKIISITGHDSTMPPADQYPASKLGIMQVNVTAQKQFFVAAAVTKSEWSLANGAKIDVAGPPRHELPYAHNPRRKVMGYLEQA